MTEGCFFLIQAIFHRYNLALNFTKEFGNRHYPTSPENLSVSINIKEKNVVKGQQLIQTVYRKYWQESAFEKK